MFDQHDDSYFCYSTFNISLKLQHLDDSFFCCWTFNISIILFQHLDDSRFCCSTLNISLIFQQLDDSHFWCPTFNFHRNFNNSTIYTFYSIKIYTIYTFNIFDGFDILHSNLNILIDSDVNPYISSFHLYFNNLKIPISLKLTKLLASYFFAELSIQYFTHISTTCRFLLLLLNFQHFNHISTSWRFQLLLLNF